MARLIIQINSTVPGDDFSWLPNDLGTLGEFGLDVHCSVMPPLPVPPPDFAWTDSLLYSKMVPLIENSPLRQQSEQTGDWFVDLFITSKHSQGYLGLMYDYGAGNRSRQGCAIFWQEVWRLSFNNVGAYRTIMRRTALHEIGHCFNLGHEHDGTLMTQTDEIQDSTGQWINHINFNYAQEEISWVVGNQSQSRPGGADAAFGILEDIGVPSKALSVSLSYFADPDHPALTAGAPLPLLVKIANKNTAPVGLNLPLDFSSGNIKVWLTKDREPERLIKHPVRGCSAIVQKINLSKGDHFLPLYLFGGAGGYLFALPGNYKVRIAIKGDEGNWYRSPRLRFTVNEGSQEEKAQLEYINSDILTSYFLLGGKVFDGTARRLKEMIAIAPYSQISRAAYWSQLYDLKHQALHENDMAALNKIRRLQREIYSHLLQSETSSIRRGKAAIAYKDLGGSQSLPVDPTTAYNSFKKKMVKYNP